MISEPVEYALSDSVNLRVKAQTKLFRHITSQQNICYRLCGGGLLHRNCEGFDKLIYF